MPVGPLAGVIAGKGPVSYMSFSCRNRVIFATAGTRRPYITPPSGYSDAMVLNQRTIGRSLNRAAQHQRGSANLTPQKSRPILQIRRPVSCPPPGCPDSGPPATLNPKKSSSPYQALLFDRSAVLNVPKKGPDMIDPSSTLGRELKAAENFFALAKGASSPFMRAYYQRVAERYLSSEGELNSLKKIERCSRLAPH